MSNCQPDPNLVPLSQEAGMSDSQVTSMGGCWTCGSGVCEPNTPWCSSCAPPRQLCNCPSPGAAGLVQLCPVHDCPMPPIDLDLSDNDAEMRYLYRRGAGAKHRVMHLAQHDQLGELTMQPICGRANGVQFDTTCNVPLGRPLCKRCRALVGGT